MHICPFRYQRCLIFPTSAPLSFLFVSVCVCVCVFLLLGFCCCCCCCFCCCLFVCLFFFWGGGLASFYFFSSLLFFVRSFTSVIINLTVRQCWVVRSKTPVFCQNQHRFVYFNLFSVCFSHFCPLYFFSFRIPPTPFPSLLSPYRLFRYVR